MKYSSSFTRRSVTPSAAYLWRIPGKQALGSGVPVDVSGHGKNAAFGASNTDALSWANAGDMTTTALGSTDGGFSIPGTGSSRATPWEATAGTSLILCGEVSCTGTGVNVMGDSTLSAGLLVGATSGLNAQGVSGGLKFSIQDLSGHTYTTGALDRINTGVRTSFFIFLNGATKLARVWVAGKEQTNLTGGGDFSAITASIASPFAWSWGHAGNPSASGTAATKQRNGSALLLQPGVLPPDVAKLAAYFSNCPDRVLPMSLVGA